jgi:hypothetical protein
MHVIRAAKWRKECSPRRKPWVKERPQRNSREGAEDTDDCVEHKPARDMSFAPLGLDPIRLNPRLAPWATFLTPLRGSRKAA